MKLFPLSLISSKAQKGNGGSSRANLYLNVYDLSPVNNYLYWFGFGVFHSGIEGFGLEYGFGASEDLASGVYEVEPRSCPGFNFRRSVLLGSTDMSQAEFRLFMENISEEYRGNTYHFISKNCNHFSDEVCVRLTGKPIPKWVNRLAKLGSFCSCFPPSIQLIVVHLPDHPEWSDDELDSGRSSLESIEDSDYHMWTASSGSTSTDESKEAWDQHLSAASESEEEWTRELSAASS